MKTIARIATGAFLAFMSLFIAAPAFASEDGGQGIGAAVEFATSGAPVEPLPILIVGAVLLVVVFATAIPLGNLFNQDRKRG